MSLTSPLIDQAFTLRTAVAGSMSETGIFHQLFALRTAYSSSFTRTSFVSLISVITIA
jgi:hypothetical protein